MSIERTLDGILPATEKISSASSEQEIVTAATRELTKHTDFSIVRMYRQNEEGLSLKTNIGSPVTREKDAHAGTNEHILEAYREQCSTRCCPRPHRRSDTQTTIRSSLSVPIGSRGVIEVVRHKKEDFEEAEIHLLTLFATFLEKRLVEETRCSIRYPDEKGSDMGDTGYDRKAKLDSIVIGEVRPDGTIDEWRGAALEAYVEIDKGVSLSALSIIPKSQKSTVRNAVSSVFESGMPYSIDLSVPPGNAGLTDIRLTITPTSVSDDPPQQAIAIINDISERKSRERDLESFKPFLDRSNDGFYIIESESSVILDVNETATQMIGYEREELAGMTIPEINPEFTRDSWKSFVSELQERGNVVLETTHRCKDGSHVPVEIEIAYVEFDQAYHVATVRDISSRQERQRRLEEARTRYQTLFQLAPDPIVVADIESNEIVEVNEAAGQIRGQSCAELIGQQFQALHPPAKRHTYSQLFEDCDTAQSGRMRNLPDGSPMELRTTTGEDVPIEISYHIVDLDGRRLVYIIFRDVRDQLAHERSLKAVNEAARVLFEAEHPSEVATQLVGTVTDALDFEVAAVYLTDEDEGVLRPVVYEPESRCEELFDRMPMFGPGGSLAWEAFETGEPRIVKDMSRAQDVYNPSTPIKSEIIHPIGEHGVLIVGDLSVGGFDQREVDLLQILAATGDIALDRTEREQRIRSQRHELETRTEQLEELESINAQTRNIMQAVVNAETRPDIEETVCAEVVETDSIAFAWIGESNPMDDRLSVRAWSGTDRGYLDQVDFQAEGSDQAEPAVRAIASGEPVSVENTARQMGSSAWRREALRAEYRSIYSIPLEYNNTHLGVLTVYSPETYAFTGVIRSVLNDIGSLLANGLVAIERKSALLSNHVTELEFIIRDPSCFFLRYAQQMDANIELDRIIPQEDHSWLVFVHIENDPPEDLLAAADEGPSTQEPQLVESADGTLVQIRFVEPFIATQLADYGISVRSISADDSGCRVRLAGPATKSPHAITDIVTGLYPHSELVAKRERQLPQEEDADDRNPLSKLTPRQREVLAFAHAHGFFKSPRTLSGAELAEELNLSSSAFHRHVRSAENSLMEWIFEQYEIADMANFADQSDPNYEYG